MLLSIVVSCLLKEFFELFIILLLFDILNLCFFIISVDIVALYILGFILVYILLILNSNFLFFSFFEVLVLTILFSKILLLVVVMQPLYFSLFVFISVSFTLLFFL